MARLRADRARALLRQPALGPAGEPAGEADALVADALSAAEALGMTRLVADVRALQAASAAGQV